ncbi:MAG: hypothetical protein DKM50_09300 [Candidatus Margulisiibacteriota bacterium]|nr:MAG: hypothetical protein A2X43_02190 [Candidatus Margulisbacteria bacterium GWD2_39_127]OGI00884.1 MAG: hypothetical protein A2X42_03065 [Candidatus Margulisbacteria bacterium GWF2_38_17]OGI08739.1 MAG: hypothetical protein A2X41_05320 [Candidatus Margulisbacteria bacterium GWE2_39_32]PZM79450.1 MAG: hypothetical protein DKM50_09300 [Candidatus Margulisiibacteriota bacterium]HAR63496.1 hypothetical protein [Candidatus Margulisiibacteriota bacterium]
MKKMRALSLFFIGVMVLTMFGCAKPQPSNTLGTPGGNQMQNEEQGGAAPQTQPDGTMPTENMPQEQATPNTAPGTTE